MENFQLWTFIKICSVNQHSGLWSHYYLGGHGRWNYEWTETETKCAYIMLTSHFITLFLCISCNSYKSPHIRESITVLDSGFHAVDSGFQVLDSWICHWNLDPGFQSWMWFRIPWASFRGQKKNRKDNLSLILSSLLSSHRFMLSRVIDTQFSVAVKLIVKMVV